MIHQQHTIRSGGHILDLTWPQVMGILNVTPDSFFDGGKYQDVGDVLERADRMWKEGVRIMDIGGMSSRPGADEVSVATELQRVLPVIEAIQDAFPGVILSVDTWRAEVARKAVEAGAGMINDISAGQFEPEIMRVAADHAVPFVAMHMQGEPKTMQTNPRYDDVTREVLEFFVERVRVLRYNGVKDIILDPGFGFGKTVRHNFKLLDRLRVFGILELPILVGISRKSMICRVLNVKPEQALNGTSALHMVALLNGAAILRVHDVHEALEVSALYRQIRDVQNAPGDSIVREDTAKHRG